jgi:hypothetical protein
MKRIACLLFMICFVPAQATAQQVLSERLTEVLPPEIAMQVLAQIESAGQEGLPAQAMANVALEGVAKGRSASEVLASVELLGADLSRARQALESGGHGDLGGEVEAATVAMRMGVDGAQVSELASSQPSGRSLSVPLMVIGGLVQRGLPADEALVAVQARLAAGADDAGLLGHFPEVGRELSAGLRPEQVGPARASGFAGFQVPVSDVTVPVQQPAPVGRPGGN